MAGNNEQQTTQLNENSSEQNTQEQLNTDAVTNEGGVAVEQKEDNVSEEIDVVENNDVVNEEQKQHDTEQEINEEQLLAQLNKLTGRTYQSLSELRPEPTDEERKQVEILTDKKLYEKAAQKGIDVQRFAQIKTLATIKDEDKVAYGKQVAVEELTADGYTREEAIEKIERDYPVLTEDELEEAGDEDKRAHEIAKKQLAKKASVIQDSAKSFLNNLQQDIDDSDLELKVDAELVSKVETYAAKLDKKIIVELGSSNDIKLSPVEYTIEDSVVEDVKNTLKDKAAREKIFYNPDGSENVELIFDLLIKAKSLDKLSKVAAIKGTTQAVEHFQTVFPAHPASVGITTERPNATNGVGKAVKVGKPIVRNNSQRVKI